MHIVRVRTNQNVVTDYPFIRLGDGMLTFFFDALIQGVQALLCWFVFDQLQSHTNNINILIDDTLLTTNT